MRHATSKQPHLILITFLATETTTATAYYPAGGITKPLEMPRQPKLTRVKKETKAEGSSERRAANASVFFLFFRK
jgi:hypothetical protein